MYESIIDLVNNEATVLFVKINYTLVTEEAERIGLDHMARSSTTQQVCSMPLDSMTSRKSANRMSPLMPLVTTLNPNNQTNPPLSSLQSVADSVVSEHLRVQYNAIKMLRDRIKIINDYVKAMKENEVPMDQEILREVNNLCNYLPIVESENSKFNESFYNQWNDVALIAYLGSLTKGSNSLNQFVQKFTMIYDKHQNMPMSRRMRMF